jgi:C1A family cysteine protease
MGRRLDGCMRDVPSPKDHLATPLLSTLPRQVDLREHCGAVEDQGQVGSCTANAAVGAMEYQMKKAGKPSVELSRMFVYFNARRMRAAVDVDTGATIAECMASFLAYGAPPEQAWPYDPNLISKTPDQAAYNAALDYVPTEYARVKGFESIKGSLAQQYPVVFGISLPSACYDEAGKTGMMPKVTAAEVEAGRAGGHAMLIVGYDTDAGVFLVRNSWGHGWGERGYFRMPFDTFNAATSSVDSWILGKLDDSREFHIVRPEVTVKPVEGGVKDMAAKMREEIRGSLTKDIKDSFKEIKDRVNRRNPQ